MKEQKHFREDLAEAGIILGSVCGGIIRVFGAEVLKAALIEALARHDQMVAMQARMESFVVRSAKEVAEEKRKMS